MHEPTRAWDRCSGQPVGLGLGAQGRHLPGQVGRVGADHVGLEGGQVDLDHPVEVGGRVGVDLVVGPEVGAGGLGGHGHRLAAGGGQVARPMRSSKGKTDVVAPISAPMLQMVALPVALMAAVPGSEVLDDGAGAALDGEDLGHPQDDVLGRRPARQPAGEADADQRRPPQAERAAGHHVDRVGPAHADGHHAQPAGVGGVAVGADHHPAGEGVALEDDLVDDPRPRLPEADAVLGRDAGQEVVDLLVGLLGRQEVGDGAHLGQDQVVAVDGGGHLHPGQAGGGELEQRHLGGGVLHGHPVGLQLDVGLAPLEAGRVGHGVAGQVAEEDLLGQGERPPEPGPGRGRRPRPGGRRRPRSGPGASWVRRRRRAG